MHASSAAALGKAHRSPAEVVRRALEHDRYLEAQSRARHRAHRGKRGREDEDLQAAAEASDQDIVVKMQKQMRMQQKQMEQMQRMLLLSTQAGMQMQMQINPYGGFLVPSPPPPPRPPRPAELAKLAANLAHISPGNVSKAVEIIQSEIPGLGNGEQEIAIDIDSLNNATLWRLHDFLETCVKKAKVVKLKASRPQTVQPKLEKAAALTAARLHAIRAERQALGDSDEGRRAALEDAEAQEMIREAAQTQLAGHIERHGHADSHELHPDDLRCSQCLQVFHNCSSPLCPLYHATLEAKAKNEANMHSDAAGIARHSKPSTTLVIDMGKLRDFLSLPEHRLNIKLSPHTRRVQTPEIKTREFRFAGNPLVKLNGAIAKILEQFEKKQQYADFVTPAAELFGQYYLNHITRPMDIQTMKKKAIEQLDERKYQRSSEFRADIELMLSNFVEWNTYQEGKLNFLVPTANSLRAKLDEELGKYAEMFATLDAQLDADASAPKLERKYKPLVGAAAARAEGKMMGRC